jgi:hypothetical protein
MARSAITAALILVAQPALAESMNADSAWRFVVGKMFTYNCFDGTRGAGRIGSDLSVSGTIQIRGIGPVRFVVLPPATLKIKGETVCASVRGIPFEPCFKLNKTNANSFRGAVQGFDFAYCEFTHRIERGPSSLTSWPGQSRSQPLTLPSASTAPSPGD